MKKLTFKVSLQKDCSFVSLIKEIDKISCRIYLDLENGLVAVENVNDTIIDTVIELIDQYYTILSVNIDNTIEGVAEKQVINGVEEPSEEEIEESVRKEAIVEKHPVVLEPQSGDDLLIKKVKFKNGYVENLVNKFLRTAYWAMFKMNVSEKEIGDFIFTSIDEISMRYNNKPCIEISVGDIVDCSYGTHLIGEINGRHVAAIVCNIHESGMAYLVPITKMQSGITSHSYLIFNSPEDVIYENEMYKGGIAIIEKAKYVRAERINAVIGKTTPDFFKKLLLKLASTFDFTSCLEKADETVVEAEESTDEVDTAYKEVKVKATNKKVSSEETALLEVIGFAFDKLDASKKVEEQIEEFLTDIGMSTTERIVTQAFIVACNIKKINYENVILELHTRIYPKVDEDIIKYILKETFKNWLNQYPVLAKKCPKISLMSVLKVFAKRFV